MEKGPVSQFITHHYRHFNAAALIDAAKGYEAHIDAGGKMMITLGGAMSTAELGISLAELRPQVRRLESVPHRLELSKRVGMTLIDDSYNSNPSGTKAALETLSFFEGEKILVTPGMVELGDKQEEYNCEFGRNAAAVCDYVALVGERQTKSIYKGLVEAGFDESRIFVSPSLGDALAKVGAIRTDKKKIVLLENDLPDNY